MTDGARKAADMATEYAKELAPDVLAAFKVVAKQHGRMLAAKSVLRGVDADDAGYPEAVDEYDVQRGLFKQAVELQARDLGKEALAALLLLFVDVVG